MSNFGGENQVTIWPSCRGQTDGCGLWVEIASHKISPKYKYLLIIIVFFKFSEYHCHEFQQEIAPHVGKYCKQHSDIQDTGFCDGTKIDCVKKGKEKCLSDSNCYGFMYKFEWASKHQGIKICTGWALIDNIEKDWSIFMRCSEGN